MTIPEDMPQQQDDAIDQLKEQLSACEDKYLRLLAESENTRKRMLKERQELTQHAVENVLSEFLHPLDNLENALKLAVTMSQEVKHWATGFEMIATQFKQVLANHGVEEFASVGLPFDPHHHEAVEVVETTESAPGTVIEQFISGYRRGERTIRVSRVKVAKAPAQGHHNQEEQLGE